SLGGSLRLLGHALRDLHLHERRQERNRYGRVPRRVEAAKEESRRDRVLAAQAMDLDARSKRLGEILVPRQQALRLLDPSLEDPKVRELRRRMDTTGAMTRPFQRAQRLDQTLLRGREVALRLEE